MTFAVGIGVKFPGL